MITIHSSFAARFSSAAEHRLLRLSTDVPETGNAMDTGAERTRRHEGAESRALPTNDEEGREYVDKLIDETDKELHAAVRVPLQRARERLEWARANIPDLPEESRRELDAFLGQVNAEILRQEVGGLLKYVGGVTIEYRAGQDRPMRMRDGITRIQRLTNDYGSLRYAYGRDGDKQDIFIGDYLQDCTTIFRINQGDELKDMIGFRSASEARDAYLRNHPEMPPDQIAMPQAMPVEEYRRRFSGQESATV